MTEEEVFAAIEESAPQGVQVRMGYLPEIQEQRVDKWPLICVNPFGGSIRRVNYSSAYNTTYSIELFILLADNLNTPSDDKSSGSMVSKQKLYAQADAIKLALFAKLSTLIGSKGVLNQSNFRGLQTVTSKTLTGKQLSLSLSVIDVVC